MQRATCKGCVTSHRPNTHVDPRQIEVVNHGVVNRKTVPNG